MPVDVRQDFPAYTADVGPHADGEADAGRPARVFYGVDSRRITIGEAWRGAPASLPLVALLRLLRMRLPIATDDPAVESLGAFEVPEREIPVAVRERLLAPAIQLREVGFRDPIYHVVDDTLQKARTYLVTAFDPTGQVWARIHHREWHLHTPARIETYCEMVSELPGGEFLWSVSARPGLAPPAPCALRSHRGATPAELLHAHEAELQLRGADHALPLVTPQERRAGIERHHVVVRDDRIARGLFVPLNVDEPESAATDPQDVPGAQQDGARDVLDRIAPRRLLQFEHLRERSPAWLASPTPRFVQLGALVAGVAIAFVLYSGMTAPSRQVRASPVQVVQTPGDSALAAPRTVLVATFADDGDAASALPRTVRRAGPGAGVARVGRSVLVSFPVDDAGALGALQSKLDDAGVATLVATRDAPAVLRLSCTLPSAAAVATLDAELSGYLATTLHHPAPPWHPGLRWSDAERAAHGRARATWLRMSRAAAEVNGSPMMLASLGALAVAARSGDTATVGRQRAELAALGDSLRAAAFAAVRAEPGADTLVADGFVSLRAATGPASMRPFERAALAARFGPLPRRRGRPAPGSTEWSANGTTIAAGRVLTAQVHFTNTFQGATAFARWMVGKGCAGVTSSFS